MRRSLLMGFLLVAAMVLPSTAYAASGSYSIDELSTEIIVGTNGSTSIIERQAYTFDSRCEGCVWYLHVPESNESVRISSVKVAPIDDGGTPIGDWTTLQPVDVDRQAQGQEPGDTASWKLRQPATRPWYSYSIGDGMIRCYFPTAEPETGTASSSTAVRYSTQTSATNTYLIETDYVISRRVRVYSDVAELYWRYANSSLPVQARDVSLHVVLPMPEDAGEIVPGETIAAWGHGPTGGSFEIGADGTVTYHIDAIDSGNYAEAHMVFPASWIYAIDYDAPNRFTYSRRAAAFAEESQWVDIGMRGENWDNGVRVLFLALASVIILIGVASVVRYGRSPLSRRALIRASATLGIVALGEHLFFREPLTTGILAGLAAVVGLASFSLPAPGTEPEDPPDTSDADAQPHRK